MLLLASILSKMGENKAYTFGVTSIYNQEREKLEKERLKRKRKIEEIELEEKEVTFRQELVKKNDEELKKKIEKEKEFFDFR